MGLLRQTIGLALIVLAWFDPLNLGIKFRIVLFILGFDMVSLLVKFVVFGIDYFLGIGIGWILLLLVAAEIVTKFLFVKSFLDSVLKPLAVFVILILSNLGLEIAIIVAGIDLLLNMTKKWL
ncbi:MAG: hypothetical protein QMD36_05100 [Candidatus Aenigmarchaeota archaeon]|nr:hypothetical protein [Candidatus Aenigmarchaeota archaeon]